MMWIMAAAQIAGFVWALGAWLRAPRPTREDAERAANYARIVAEDEALIARTRLSALGVKPEPRPADDQG